jgi:BarA-like signal transduction histidine kinase
MLTSRRDAYLEPTSVVAALIYSLLLASGLVAQVMGFPTFSREPRATSLITIDVPEPLASRDETIGYR